MTDDDIKVNAAKGYETPEQEGKTVIDGKPTQQEIEANLSVEYRVYWDGRLIGCHLGFPDEEFKAETELFDLTIKPKVERK